MSREALGNFELMVLFAILRIGEDAYGVPISDALEERSGREVLLGSVYAALERLEVKGLVVTPGPVPARRGSTVSRLEVSGTEPWSCGGELYGGGLSLLWCIGSALIGRLVARMQSMALVLVSVAAQLPFILWWGVPIWLRAAAYVGLRPAHPLNFRVVAAVVLVEMPLSRIVAGLSAAQSSRERAF